MEAMISCGRFSRWYCDGTELYAVKMANRSTSGFFHEVASCSSDSVKMMAEPAAHAYASMKRLAGSRTSGGYGKLDLCEPERNSVPSSVFSTGFSSHSTRVRPE